VSHGALVALVAALVLLGACGTGAAPGPAAGVITVGSFNFPESVLLGEVYAQALAGAGYPVRTTPALGPRELVAPALQKGLIQLVPEYAGSALEFASLGRAKGTADIEATHRALVDTLSRTGVVARAAAPAQDANAIVVTTGTATRYGLRTVSDLVPLAERLVFGGPAECPARAECLVGLRDTYGLHFKSFVALDTGGPLTRQALAAGGIDVALLFTTDPNIARSGFVVLADDRHLQPAENVTPVLTRATSEQYGPAIGDLLDRVSLHLDTQELSRLDGQMELEGAPAALVAANWLKVQGFAATGAAHG
jgi:osmoprotectant transport system substrate-binding protein